MKQLRETEKCWPSKLSRYALFLLTPLVLIACDATNTDPTTDKSTFAFKVPERIRNSQSIDQQQIFASVQAGNRQVSLTRDGNNFTGAINIESGTELSYTLQIIEMVGTRQVVLATLSDTRLITNDTSISLTANQYTYPDNDSDGFNNLIEREAGADYANSNSTPDNIDGLPIGNETTPGVLQFSAQDYTVAEAAGTLTIDVNRVDGTDGRVSVRYRLDNETAIGGQDYATTSGILVWEEGDNAAKSIDITVFSDTDFEGSQTFTVHLYSATGGAAVGNGFSRITLQDSTPPPQRGTLQIADTSLIVSESDNQVIIEIERVGGSDGPVTVEYTTTDGTATGTADYASIDSPRTLTWPDGDITPRNISIGILQDLEIEPTETFQVNLSGIRGGATLGSAIATVEITDTTPPAINNGTVSIANSTYTVSEGSALEIPVERVDGSDGAASVTYNFTSGTADSTDYTASPGTLSWTDGDDSTKVITLTATTDNTPEAAETLTVEISSATGGISLQNRSAQITITDTTQANPGTVAFVESTGTVDEGSSISIQVARSGGFDQSISVQVAAVPTNDIEYTVESDTLTWADGESGSKAVTITALSDAVTADTLTLTLSLSLASDATNATPVISTDIYSLTINDTSESGFISLADTDGEWEVCLSPYSTDTTSAFSTQLSATSGTVVTCIKKCPADAVVDTAFRGWGWNNAASHSCAFTTTTEGSLTKAVVYTPTREQFSLNLQPATLSVPDSIWLCTRENRQNAEFSYTQDVTANTWYQILADGTYYYADSADNVTVPAELNGPEIWSATTRYLSFSHIGEVYRNIIMFPAGQTFQVHPDTDHRLSCSRSDYSDSGVSSAEQP